MIQRIKFFVLILSIVAIGFSLSSCAGYTTAVFTSTAHSKYKPIPLQKSSGKNIKQTYNPLLDTQTQYPTGKVDVVFEDLAVRLNPTVATPAMFLDGSKYYPITYKQAMLSYAKQIMPNVDFVVKNKPNFNSQTPQLVFLPSFYDHATGGIIDFSFNPMSLTFAVFHYDGKYYLVSNQTRRNSYIVFVFTVFTDYFKDYYPLETVSFYPIFPAVKAIMLQSENKPLSPYLSNWLNQVQQWQPAPINNHKIAFKVTIGEPKLPCVYNYHWTYNQKDSQGKKYEKATPAWAAQLKGIAPYLFMPENSTACKKIKSTGGNLTQAILQVYMKDWGKQTNKLFSKWDKVKNETVGAGNQTAQTTASK